MQKEGKGGKDANGKLICYDMQVKGNCHRGLACNFSYELGLIPADDGKKAKQENRQSLRSNRKICIVSFATNAIPSPSGEDNVTRLSTAHSMSRRIGYAQYAIWKAIVTQSANFDKEAKLMQSKYLNLKGSITETPPRCLLQKKTLTWQANGDNN